MSSPSPSRVTILRLLPDVRNQYWNVSFCIPVSVCVCWRACVRVVMHLCAMMKVKQNGEIFICGWWLNKDDNKTANDFFCVVERRNFQQTFGFKKKKKKSSYSHKPQCILLKFYVITQSKGISMWPTNTFVSWAQIFENFELNDEVSPLSSLVPPSLCISNMTCRKVQVRWIVFQKLGNLVQMCVPALQTTICNMV